MHATEIQWYIVVCYDKLSVQHCLCIWTDTELNLKGVSVKTPETCLDLPLWIEAIEGGQQAT